MADAGSDCARRTGHKRHMASQREFPVRSQLGMLEGAIFHGKEFAFRHAGVLAHGCNLRFDCKSVSCDIAHDPGSADISSGTDRADSGHEDHAGKGIEPRHAFGHATDMTLDIGVICGCIVSYGGCHLSSELRDIPIIRLVDPERQSLGPDQVIGGQRRREGEFPATVCIHKAERLAGNQGLEDGAGIGLIRITGREGERAPHGWGDLGVSLLRYLDRRLDLDNHRLSCPPAGIVFRPLYD
jgi:hypothetical protein